MQHGSQRERVYAHMRQAILDGSLKPGEPIPERTIGAKLAASRLPIREALLLLQGNGLVEIVGGRGAFVRTFSIEEVRDLHDLRALLEGGACRSATGRIAVATLQEFQAGFNALLQEIDSLDVQRMDKLSNEFHALIIGSAPNELLKKTLFNIREQISLSRSLLYKAGSKETFRVIILGHLKIIDALIAGDGDRAEARMREHIAEMSPLRIALVAAGKGPG